MLSIVIFCYILIIFHSVEIVWFHHILLITMVVYVRTEGVIAFLAFLISLLFIYVTYYIIWFYLG